jgi:hypothetical protein
MCYSSLPLPCFPLQAFQGVAFHVEVFKTSNGRGWGVRTRETIPAGGYVMSYLGELRLDHDRVVSEAHC